MFRCPEVSKRCGAASSTTAPDAFLAGDQTREVEEVGPCTEVAHTAYGAAPSGSHPHPSPGCSSQGLWGIFTYAQCTVPQGQDEVRLPGAALLERDHGRQALNGQDDSLAAQLENLHTPGTALGSLAVLAATSWRPPEGVSDCDPVLWVPVCRPVAQRRVQGPRRNVLPCWICSDKLSQFKHFERFTQRTIRCSCQRELAVRIATSDFLGGLCALLRSGSALALAAKCVGRQRGCPPKTD